MAKICRKQPKHHPTSRKIPRNHLYIYLYFYGRALATSRRDLDAPKRAPDNLDPKKRMLGPAPSIFLKVDAPRTRHSRRLWRPPEYLCMWVVGAEKRQR